MAIRCKVVHQSESYMVHPSNAVKTLTKYCLFCIFLNFATWRHFAAFSVNLVKFPHLFYGESLDTCCFAEKLCYLRIIGCFISSNYAYSIVDIFLKLWSCVEFMWPFKICNMIIIINTVDQPVWSLAYVIGVMSCFDSPKVDYDWICGHWINL